jgi:nitroreductase
VQAAGALAAEADTTDLARDPASDLALDERMRALEEAADEGLLAPSAHDTQPWLLVLHRDRLDLRADRTRQLLTLDPSGRTLTQSIGAALLNVRVALAARGWATSVERLPRPDDPDLLAVVRPLADPPPEELARLATAVHERRTDRRRFAPGVVAADLVQHLTEVAAAEDVELLPVLSDESRRLVAELTAQAATQLDTSPALRADLQRWDPRTTPAPERRVSDQPFLLIATRTDDPLAWLRSGEALERLLLELTRLGWAAGPVSQPIEVPATRHDLCVALTWDRHPQMLIRFGHVEPMPDTPRRDRAEVLRDGDREVRAADVQPDPGDGTTAR